MPEPSRAELLANHLEPFVRRASHEEPPDGESARPRDRAVPAHPEVDAAISIELRTLLRHNEELRELSEDGSKEGRRKTADLLRVILEHADDHVRDLLWALVAGPAEKPPTKTRTPLWWSDGWLARRVAGAGRMLAGAGMNALIAVVVTVIYLIVWPSGESRWSPGASALALFALWCLAFLPCWLYVRFVGLQGGALWDEYVLNLHRLRVDEPRYLPRPPETSDFYAEWIRDGGDLHAAKLSLYRQKFDSYFGRSLSKKEISGRNGVYTDSMFPVFLLTAVLATCWAAVLWEPRFVDDASGAWDALKFGFLGAYFFIFQMLIRRFFQSDLRPSAYAASVLRIIVVLLLVATLHQLPYVHDSRGWEAGAAFIIGIFPLAGVRVLEKSAAFSFGWGVPSMKPAYPLNLLDGLNVWYEARLLEEGIEDLENLVTANLVDVLLHTRVPVDRLVDWIDQAHLYLHLSPGKKPRRQKNAWENPDPPAKEERFVLRERGVRTATDLVKVYKPDREVPDGDPDARWYALSRLFKEERSLNPVWNWQERGISRRHGENTCPH